MRICVCATGQLRAFQDSFENLRQATKGHDVTYIFSTWSKIGRRTAGAVGPSQLNRMFDKNAGNALTWSWLGANLQDIFPEIYSDVVSKANEFAELVDPKEAILSYFPEAIVDVEDASLLDLTFDESRQDINSLKMLYKAWRGNEIKRAVERKNNFRFDYVIRMRPDFRLNYLDMNLIRETCDEKTIFVDGHMDQKLWSDDSLAIGTSAAIDKSSGVFGVAIADRGGWDYIHRSLAAHLNKTNLDFTRYPHHGYITPDKKLSAKEVGQSLWKQRAVGHIWSPMHELSYHSISAVDCIESDDFEQSSSHLQACSGILNDHFELWADSAFYASGVYFRKAKDPVRSALCFLLTSFSRKTVSHSEHWATFEALAEQLSMIPGDIDVFDAQITLATLFAGKQEVWLEDVIRATSKRFALTTLRGSIDEYYSHLFSIAQFLRSIKKAFGEMPGVCIHALTNLAEIESPSLGEVFELADLLKRQGRFEEAFKYQAVGLSQQADHAGANRQMGEICFNMGRWSEAHNFAQRAVELAPNAVTHRALYAIACLKVEDKNGLSSAVSSLPRELYHEVDELMIPNVRELVASAIATSIA